MKMIDLVFTGNVHTFYLVLREFRQLSPVRAAVDEPRQRLDGGLAHSRARRERRWDL